MGGAAQLAALLQVMAVVDVVLHKALIPVIPLQLCCNSLCFCMAPIPLFVLLPAARNTHIGDRLASTTNGLGGVFPCARSIRSGVHEHA